jgi:hypothetical protein
LRLCAVYESNRTATEKHYDWEETP